MNLNELFNVVSSLLDERLIHRSLCFGSGVYHFNWASEEVKAILHRHFIEASLNEDEDAVRASVVLAAYEAELLSRPFDQVRCEEIRTRIAGRVVDAGSNYVEALLEDVKELIDELVGLSNYVRVVSAEIADILVRGAYCDDERYDVARRTRELLWFVFLRAIDTIVDEFSLSRLAGATIYTAGSYFGRSPQGPSHDVDVNKVVLELLANGVEWHRYNMAVDVGELTARTERGLNRGVEEFERVFGTSR